MLRPIELLTARHDPSGFESGVVALDDWLIQFALPAQRSNSTRVYVLASERPSIATGIDRPYRRDSSSQDADIVGFYALSAGSVRPDHAPTRVRRGQGRHDLPLVILTRLGVDRRSHGQGLGAALLEDVLTRVDAAVDIIGARAVHAHAKDERARSFYEHFGFEPSPLDRHSMFLLIKDLRASRRQR
jgi:GNAT superfamily N-acetyltransferase